MGLRNKGTVLQDMTDFKEVQQAKVKGTQYEIVKCFFAETKSLWSKGSVTRDF